MSPPSSSPPPGIVRNPRRPPGWHPGGPAPAGSQGDPQLDPGPGEDLCYLAGDFRIFQRQDGHRWSLDDLLTAHLAARLCDREPKTFLDLGSGIGSVLMMLAWRFPEARGLGIEAQELSADLARRSLRFNGLENRIAYRHGDFRTEAGLGGARFDLITGTPPYFLPAHATQSAKPQCGPCRFEWRGGVEDYLRVAAAHVQADGLFVMVTAAAQSQRVVAAACALGLERFFEWVVVPKAGKAPLIVVHACAPKWRHLQSETLVVRDEANQWTAPFRQIRLDMGMPIATR